MDAISPANFKRGAYDVLTSAFGRDHYAIQCDFLPALPEEYSEWDRKKRGGSLSCDLYGYDPEQQVAVFQVRSTSRIYARQQYLSIRKCYILAGFNELTKLPFRHPVGSHAVRAAINAGDGNPISVVRAAQKWMWQCTDKQLDSGLRQGDVLIVKERGNPAAKDNAKALGTSHIIGGSHVIKAAEIVELDGRIYARDPMLSHAKGQHEPVWGEEGWHSVRIAREADAWDFAERVGD